MKRIITAVVALCISNIAALSQGVVPTLLVQPPSNTNLTDISGTITLGGSAQTIAAANNARQGFCIQNISTGDLWINTLTTAVNNQPSLWLPAGTYWCMPVPDHRAISIIGPTTGQAFYARQW